MLPKRALDFHHYLNRYAHLETSDYRMVIPAGTCSYASAGVSHSGKSCQEHTITLFIQGKTTQLNGGFMSEEDGLYNIAVTYYPVPGRRSSIQREIYINGELPYEEAGFIEFHRVWGNGCFGFVAVNNQGMKFVPAKWKFQNGVQFSWQTQSGTCGIPLSFYLKRGWNTIALVSRREPVVIGQLRY